MRLLDVDTEQLVEVAPDEIPEYAILSHTWERNEVTFADIHGDPKEYKAKAGWDKISGACEQARRDQLRFLWVDTCCIDKTSSAELSEAINSMFAWYQAAKFCYAYLIDVMAQDEKTVSGPFSFHTAQQKPSRWFTRGWTLQELLAPTSVRFYSRTWSYIGDKKTLAASISHHTGVSVKVLKGEESLDDVSVAQRMSWASNRTTTRVEDLAYCLLGIFDINLPLIYGEGKKAFIRLQEEIIRTSDDQSIFAWTVLPEDSNEDTQNDYTCGLLATSPSQFSNCSRVRTSRSWSRPSRPFSITNSGIALDLELLELPEGVPNYQPYAFAYLDCTDEGVSCHLKLRCISSMAGQYVRVITSGASNDTVSMDESVGRARWEKVFVRQKPIMRPHKTIFQRGQIVIDSGFLRSRGYRVPASIDAKKNFLGPDRWERVFPHMYIFNGNASDESLGLLIEHIGSRATFVVLIGSSMGETVPYISAKSCAPERNGDCGSTERSWVGCKIVERAEILLESSWIEKSGADPPSRNSQLKDDFLQRQLHLCYRSWQRGIMADADNHTFYFDDLSSKTGFLNFCLNAQALRQS